MVLYIDIVVFGILLLANLALGLYFAFFKCGKGVVTTRDLFLGSRTLNMVPLALSTMASTVSGLSMVAFTAHFYAYGLHMTWNVPSFLLYMPFLVNLVVPTLYNLRLTSVFEVSCGGFGPYN